MIQPTPTKIIYVHAHEQPTLDELASQVEFRREIDEADLTPEKLGHQPTILILDDVFADLSDRFLYRAFTSISHHASCSILCVLQHLFMKTKAMRVLQTNSHYSTLFRSPRDMLSIRHLNTQMFPHNPGFLTWAFGDATRGERFSSLTLDCSPESDDDTRVRKTSFPGDQKVVVYMPEQM